MITPASHEVSRVSWYSGTPTLCYLDFGYATVTRYGRPFQVRSPIFSRRLYGSHNPGKNRFGLFPVRSPLLRESLTIYFPLLTKMFQFSRYPSTRLTAGDSRSLNREDFSIRTSSDQSLFGSSPRLFATYYLLLRLLLPRHPPYTLTLTLTLDRAPHKIFNTQCLNILNFKLKNLCEARSSLTSNY